MRTGGSMRAAARVRVRQRQRRLFSAGGTVNEDELQKFRVLAEEWWDPNGRNGAGPLHDMNPTRVGYICE